MVVLFLLLSLGLNGQSFDSGQIELSADGGIKGAKPRSYCGIYAAFGAASAVLKRSGEKPSVEFSELLTGEYVSSNRGSSIADLLKAIEKLGCYGKAYQCLSFRSLEGSNCPLILHVSGRGAMSSYQHWILFLGVDSEKAIVQDGEGGSFPMPISELLSRWDGKAIAVFPNNEPPNFHAWEVLASCILLGGIGFMIQVARSFAPSHSLQSQIITFLALVSVAMLYCFTINPQVAVDTCLARAVEIHTDPSTVQSLSLGDLQNVMSSSNVTLVDCRYRTDYEHGYIKDAVCVPVDATQKQLLAIAGTLPKESPIVLYCQSAGCQFSDIMAVEFAKLGFTNLSIYRNGYVEWEAKLK